MTFHFYSPVHFEPWDYRNPDAQGIGGSETSHIELCWRLAQRGHEVYSYAPIPEGCPREHKGVHWRSLSEAEFDAAGVWIIYRHPSTLDKFPVDHPTQTVWLVCQDATYSDFTADRIAKADKVLALCSDHAAYLAKHHPEITPKLMISSNGIRMDLIRKLSAVERNPLKILYASSPDRGLIPLLKIFRKAREFVPDLELHIAYGFDNYDKINPGFRTRFEKLAHQPGVYWLGRIGQERLYREWLSSGLWIHPTDFTETSCITCMEAQALGAYPITRPLWALRENVGFGTFIDGTAQGDPLTASRYVAELIRAVNTGLPEQERAQMMKWARYRFNWERVVDQWELALMGLPVHPAQFAFQNKHALGSILNVGCDLDTSEFWKRGAINVDCRRTSMLTGQALPVHLLHDVRQPFRDALLFDSVILGDILEHMEPKDILASLKNCRAVTGKRLIVTLPNDYTRSPCEQHEGHSLESEYIDGVRAYHFQPICREFMQDMLSKAGFEVEAYQPIDYTFAEGHGFVARPIV